MAPVCREGFYSPDRIPVTKHVCDIPDRLKQIDRHYFVMFNTRSQRFELHDARQRGSGRSHLGIGADRVHALVQTGAGRIVNRDHRSAGLLGQRQDLLHLARMGSAHGTALDGEILCVHVHRAALDQAIAGHDTRITCECIELDEACAIEQSVDPLARRQLASLLLLGDAIGITRQDRLLALANDGQVVFHTHVYPSVFHK